MSSKKVTILDSISNQVNPSSDESILLLRKIVKLLESNAVTDNTNRQKVSLDLYDPVTGMDSILIQTQLASGSRYSCFTATFGADYLDSRYLLFDVALNSFACNIRQGLNWT